MEIKKGISQMAEYPNAEINYVVPADGKMYYVLKNGELKNGCVIATLDPKKAIDDGVYCDSIGVFNIDGSTLIDFNKKEIKNINDEFVLAVNAIPTSEAVVNALKNESDEISKAMLKNSSTTIVDKMMIEMGITGELLFSDAYSEANIYKLDSANHKIGPDSSFIGKNDSNFYFHSNDISKETILIGLDGQEKKEAPEESGFKIPEESIATSEINMNQNQTEKQEIAETETNTEVNEESKELKSNPTVENFETSESNNEAETNISDIDADNNSFKLDISQNILDGFKPLADTQDVESKPEEDKEQPETEVNLENNFDITNDITNTDNNKEDGVAERENPESDEVLDSVIEVMKKMIEETNKLNERISELEKELEMKDKIIASQESKKNELSSLLDEANEVLDNID